MAKLAKEVSPEEQVQQLLQDEKQRNRHFQHFKEERSPEDSAQNVIVRVLDQGCSFQNGMVTQEAVSRAEDSERKSLRDARKKRKRERQHLKMQWEQQQLPATKCHESVVDYHDLIETLAEKIRWRGRRGEMMRQFFILRYREHRRDTEIAAELEVPVSELKRLDRAVIKCCMAIPKIVRRELLGEKE